MGGTWRRGRPRDGEHRCPTASVGPGGGPPRGWGHRCPTASVGPGGGAAPGMGAPLSHDISRAQTAWTWGPGEHRPPQRGHLTEQPAGLP